MKKIKFKSLDGLDIYGHISFPKLQGQLLPSILMISGGIHGGVYSKKDTYDPLHINITKYLNDKGFVTFIVDKRGSKGYGKKYLSLLDLCGDEIKDIIAGAQYLQNLRNIDPKKISIHGTSRSATTAALAISKTNIFNSAILASGFYDIYKQYKYEEKFRPDIFPTKQSMNNKDIENFPYHKRSPINNIVNISCPIFLTHGIDDSIVMPEMSKEYYNILKRNKKKVLIKFYNQFSHLKEYSYPTHKTGKEYWKDCITFLKNENLE